MRFQMGWEKLLTGLSVSENKAGFFTAKKKQARFKSSETKLPKYNYQTEQLWSSQLQEAFFMILFSCKTVLCITSTHPKHGFFDFVPVGSCTYISNQLFSFINKNS